MPRETIKARNARVSALLAQYDAVNRDANKLDSIRKGLREQIRELDAGPYGEWTLSYGTPKEIVDGKALRSMITEMGLELPMTQSQPSIIVTPKTTGK